VVEKSTSQKTMVSNVNDHKPSLCNQGKGKGKGKTSGGESPDVEENHA